MSTYKGKYYKVELIKANNNYECAISGESIIKGEHYLSLRLENGTQRLCANGRDSYTPTETIRIHRSMLGAHTVENLLELTGLFRTTEERLLLENKKLHVENHELLLANARLGGDLLKCQLDVSECKQMLNNSIGYRCILKAEVCKK